MRKFLVVALFCYSADICSMILPTDQHACASNMRIQQSTGDDSVDAQAKSKQKELGYLMVDILQNDGVSNSFEKAISLLRGYPANTFGTTPVLQYRTILAEYILQNIADKIQKMEANKLDLISKASVVCYEIGCLSKKMGNYLLTKYVASEACKLWTGQKREIIAKCLINTCSILRGHIFFDDVRHGIWTQLFFNKIVNTRTPQE